MSEIAPIVTAPLAVGSPVPDAPVGQEGLGQDTFLRLLTTQMQHQDPTDPMSNEDFVAQLAQFSSLEQLVSMQGTLEAVYMGIASMNNTSMASLLGKHVVAVHDTFAYDGSGDAVSLMYDASDSFASATLTVKDDTGKVVATTEMGGGAAGEGTVAFDGRDHDGSPLPEGEYTFSITATAESGETVFVSELVQGQITEMDYASGSPMPSLDGIAIDLGAIVRLTTVEELDAEAE
jgi:flagellar basal-body rod modification protein FlgD